MGRKSDAGERILAASTGLFWSKGFEAVGTDEICREAGVNKGTLYHFYGNKQGLALAVIRGHRELAAGFIENELAGRGASEKIIRYLTIVRDVQAERGEEFGKVPGCPCGNLSAELAGTDQEITDAVAHWFGEITEFIAANLREMNPKLTSRAAAEEAEAIFTYWEGALLMAKTRNDTVPLDTALRRIKRTIQRIKKGE